MSYLTGYLKGYARGRLAGMQKQAEEGALESIGANPAPPKRIKKPVSSQAEQHKLSDLLFPYAPTTSLEQEEARIKFFRRGDKDMAKGWPGAPIGVGKLPKLHAQQRDRLSKYLAKSRVSESPDLAERMYTDILQAPNRKAQIAAAIYKAIQDGPSNTDAWLKWYYRDVIREKKSVKEAVKVYEGYRERLSPDEAFKALPERHKKRIEFLIKRGIITAQTGQPAAGRSVA